jgi:16S rRNA (cytosine967-C5)-methyltransferase
VQDGGAQLAAALLDPRPGESILDACAAPGGKTAHLLELADNDLDLTALDLDPLRLARVPEGLARLGLSARTCIGDAAAPEGDWAQGTYQRILLDVPCSATGVIRRHPDIKWLRRDADIPRLAAQQGRILDAVWPLLAPGGTLLYVTCSLLPEENEDQVSAFLTRTRDACIDPIAAPWGQVRGPGRQILPETGCMDGFFFARLRRALP